MKKNFLFFLIIIVAFSCARKEIERPEEKKVELKRIQQAYKNPYFYTMYSFLSNINFQKNLAYITENRIFLSALSNEFDVLTLSRKENINNAISNYLKILMVASNEEETNFIKQRIAICNYKLSNYSEAAKFLFEVFSWAKNNSVTDNELFYYLSLISLGVRNEAKMAYDFIKLSKPSIATLKPLDFYYFYGKLALFAGDTNEARVNLKKAIALNREEFIKKYYREAKYYFNEIMGEINGTQNIQDRIFFNQKNKKETFIISLELPPLFDSSQDLLYFYNYLRPLRKTSIRNYPAFIMKTITNSQKIAQRFECYYDENLKNQAKGSYFMLVGLPVYFQQKILDLKPKDVLLVSLPYILFFSSEVSNVVTMENSNNPTSNIILTNVRAMKLPFNYLWKYQKVEVNNDEFWDYIFIGINEKNQIVISILDGKTLYLASTFTNNIETSKVKIYIQDIYGKGKKSLIIMDKKEKIFEM